MFSVVGAAVPGGEKVRIYSAGKEGSRLFDGSQLNGCFC